MIGNDCPTEDVKDRLRERKYLVPLRHTHTHVSSYKDNTQTYIPF